MGLGETTGGDGVLRGGGRFAVRALPGSPSVVEKRGDPSALTREAAALRRLAGSDVAPVLVSVEGGVLRSHLLPGRPCAAPDLDARDLRALGVLLRRVHDTAHQSTGRLPAWASPARTLRAYRRRRLADAVALGGPHPGTLPELPPTDEARPFRLLHGDLVGENIVWTPRGPRLVDWEFWRIGDPAEDLAYLVELNELSPQATDSVLAGYGVPDMLPRLDAWRAVVVLDAGAWYEREGKGEEASRLLRRATDLLP